MIIKIRLTNLGKTWGAAVMPVYRVMHADNTPVQGRRLAFLALLLVLVASFVTEGRAESSLDKSALIDDLVIANRILFSQGALDGYGHVSVRHPANSELFFLSKARAPAEVTVEDILEFDLDGRPLTPVESGRTLYGERFIHAEIYKARKDVNAVMHGHSPSVVPFGVTQVPLQAVAHTGSHLCGGVPVFEIRQKFGDATNTWVSSPERGKALAEALGDKPVVLMRGHGNTVVGPNVRLTVLRAVFTEVGARLQMQAMIINGGRPLTYLSPGECAAMEGILNREGVGSNTGDGVDRNWEMWKRQALSATGPLTRK